MALEMQDTLELVRQAQDVVKSRFLLCILVTQRIHQLENGAKPTIDVDPEEYTSPKSFFELALREMIEGNMDLEQVTEEESPAAI
ncbi:MAG: DNA-directed RNA polymerase subunit omega [Nitrospinaceae bacterium]|nr:DNA-directed RNA polymerase subunit omega [Nitrospinaceae bacterium]MBT6347322.1 DNA-directed RNA polymerase subunit omega [Nitrospina sp.]